MIETSLSQSRPGNTFTAGVVALLGGMSAPEVSATAGLVKLGLDTSGSWTTASTGIVNKIILVATGLAIIGGSVLLQRQRDFDRPAEMSEPLQTPIRVQPLPRVQDNDLNVTGSITPAEDNRTEPIPPRSIVPPEVSRMVSDDRDSSAVTDASGQGIGLAPSFQEQVSEEIQMAPILQGRMIDVDTGEPIPDAFVNLRWANGYEVFHASTDANGIYIFKFIGDEGSYYIFPEAADYLTPDRSAQSRETIELYKDEPVTRDFELKRGCKVFVTALDEEGLPVEGVTVYPSYAGTGSPHESKDRFQTDAKGIVGIGGLPSATYLLIAAHRDYALASQSVKLVEPQDVQSIVLSLKAGVDVAGLSTCSDGLPAGGWEIRALPTWCHSGQIRPQGVRVAEDGTFLLRHILPGPHRLEFWSIPKGGSVNQDIWSTEVTLPPSAAFLDLVIPMSSCPGAPASLSGTVFFVGHDYPEGFAISASGHSGHFGDTHLDPGEREFTLTDLVPDLYDLSVVIDGQERNFKNIRAPGEDIVLEIPIDAPGILKGRVIDAQTGHPITRFKVRRGYRDDWQQMTDPNGLFEIASRGSECQHVAVTAKHYGEVYSEEICPNSQQAIIVALRPPVTLRGRIANAQGHPLEGVAVSYPYVWSRQRFSGERESVHSDARGRFEITLGSTSEIEAFFMFQHPDYASLVRHLTIPDNPHDEVPIVMSAGGAVEGRVHDWQGNPLANTQLFWSLAADYRGAGSDEDPLARVVTDDGGFYHVEHLPHRALLRPSGQAFPTLGGDDGDHTPRRGSNEASRPRRIVVYQWPTPGEW